MAYSRCSFTPRFFHSLVSSSLAKRKNEEWHPFRVQEFCLMTVYPGPLGRALEWQAFSLLHPEGVQFHSPG